jgi:homoserine kinase type II
VTKESFLARVAESDFDAVRAPMNTLVALVASAEALAFVIESSGGLPEQIINADLHFDNVLCEGDNVTGVVDFEFAALDWRALRAQQRPPAAPASAPPNDPTTQPFAHTKGVMELVVGLSKYAGLANPLPPIVSYIRGYAASGHLTPREAELVPDLIITRILNNVVYFVGRAIAGEDSIEPIAGRAKIYVKRCEWVRDHKQDIIDALRNAGVTRAD